LERQLPSPVPNADSDPYWEAAKSNKLVLRRCTSCNEVHFMPRYLCPSCWSDKLEWIDACGEGTVHSFTIIRRASSPAFASLVPYVLVLVDLAEGPRMIANLVGDDALEVGIGDTVTLRFESRGELKLPQFSRRSAGR